MDTKIVTTIATNIEIEIPFYDVDSMNIVWHGNYVKYLELARCALLAKIDYDYETMRDSDFAWPIIELQIKYIKPLLFKQIIIVSAQIDSYEYGLCVTYTISDKASGKLLTKAKTKQVAINMTSKEMCLYSPDILTDKINTFSAKIS